MCNYNQRRTCVPLSEREKNVVPTRRDIKEGDRRKGSVIIEQHQILFLFLF